MRTYTYHGAISPKVQEGWAKAVEARDKFFRLATCWTFVMLAAGYAADRDTAVSIFRHLRASLSPRRRLR